MSVTAASTTTVYLSNAKQAFGKLTARGEARLAELRNDPRVTRVLGDLEEASSALQARLAPVLGSVRSEVVPYLDSAVDAIKEADLGEPARQPVRKPSTGRRRTTGTRPASGTTSAASSGTATKRGTSTGRGSKSTADTPAKAAARKAPAAKTTTRARKAPAAKTTTSAGKASANKA
jgi:activator of HSP90 ATPase